MQRILFIFSTICFPKKTPLLSSSKNNKGFTITELIMVMGILAVLLGFISINLIHPQAQSSIFSSLDQLVSDLKSQQTNSMLGQAGGIYFGVNSYTLFSGTTYVPDSPDNLVINLSGGVTFSTINLPSSVIYFSQLSGEVTNYISSQNFVILINSSGEGKKVIINRFGAVSIN